MDITLVCYFVLELEISIHLCATAHPFLFPPMRSTDPNFVSRLTQIVKQVISELDKGEDFYLECNRKIPSLSAKHQWLLFSNASNDKFGDILVAPVTFRKTKIHVRWISHNSDCCSFREVLSWRNCLSQLRDVFQASAEMNKRQLSGKFLDFFEFVEVLKEIRSKRKS